jgi:hypothetical protein
MRHIGYIIASFLILVVFVGLVYIGLSFAPFIQTNVLLPASEGYFSFQIEHEESFRVGKPHPLIISVEETAEKIIRSGYIDISFEPGTTFVSASGILESNIEVINADINQSQGYARIEVISNVDSVEPQLRPIAVISLQVDQVPATDTISLQVSGVFSDEKIPPTRNEILPTGVIVPVLHDATKIITEEDVLAEHVFSQSSVAEDQVIRGDLEVRVPLEAKRVQVNLVYEPEFLEVSDIVLNNNLIQDELLVDERGGEVTIKAAITGGGDLIAPLASIEYTAIKTVNKTGVGISDVRFIDEEGKAIEIAWTEVMDSENNIFIRTGGEEVDEASVIEIEVEEEVDIDTSGLDVSCDFPDVTRIAKRRELSPAQIQSLIDDICYVVERGFMRGYPDGTFGPERTMNRAEFAKVATLLVWDESAVNRAVAPYQTGEKNFANVYYDFGEKEEWFYKYVLSAKVLGISNGYADRTYRPAKSVNRAEAAKILTEAMGINSDTIDKLIYRNDIDGLAWYEKYMNVIESLLGNSILLTRGVADGDVTRTEVAQLLAGFIRFTEQ